MDYLGTSNIFLFLGRGSRTDRTVFCNSCDSQWAAVFLVVDFICLSVFRQYRVFDGGVFAAIANAISSPYIE